MANRTMSRVVPFPSHLPPRDRRDALAISPESKICSREVRICLLGLGREGISHEADSANPHYARDAVLDATVPSAEPSTRRMNPQDRCVHTRTPQWREMRRGGADALLTTPSRVDHLDPSPLLPECLQKRRHGLPQYGVAEVRRDLLEGLEHETPFVEPRVRHSELN